MSSKKVGETAAMLSMLFGAAAIGLTVVGYGAAKFGVNPFMTDYDGAERIVQDAYPHLENVEATGYGWFSCGIGESGDLWRTKFQALTPEGKEVKGVVCDGILKAATPRIF